MTATRKVLGIASGLRRRLVVMLIAPLIALALANAWFDWRSADNVAEKQDERLFALEPLFADSVISAGTAPGDPPVMLLAPGVEEFLKESHSAYAILDPDGKVLRGADWLAGIVPASSEPEFHSEERRGITWRIVAQRHQTVLGQIAVVVADGSDPRQQWASAIVFKVLLPNLVLVAAAALAVRWAVSLALKPLIELTAAVEGRSPRDLSAIDDSASPREVRPLVDSLNRLFALVNAQAESQRRFVADAAHQLRTPLAALQSQVEAWAQAAAQSREARLELPASEIEQLRHATRRTSQLANRLLALSRADSSGMQSEPLRPVELKALCESILESHLDAAEAKRIDLGLEARPASAMGHDWLLRELLANLVDNAIRYTPEGGTVTIRCGPLADAAFLEVEDDGPGVPIEERERILERFYRLPGTQGEGTGLGLAIAAEIARVHRGQLQLQSGAAGRGLKVTLVLR
ncbi:MAG TPA: ATP-binding protein [Ramlibacter sp.]|uniref:ATP-binding protein n=1 Tax=Ramlibacter sp. TaxID=1917967 RepID=UPI002C6E0C0A|nr:ATP-binding protein [Ramlibacter sp.]HVZ45135.1 ATP-binding protein [Ramlibacter sp.]